MSIKNYWTPEKKEVYETCLRNVSAYMDCNKEFTFFDGSTALAICFGLPIIETLNDLIELR